MVFSPLIGVNCIQYAKGEDWEVRRKSYYPMFKGKTLESYFPHFVHIAEVSKGKGKRRVEHESLPQDIEKKWSSLESGERVPLLKTVFSITMKGIIKCMFDESFEDQLLLDKVTAANLSAWKEMAVKLQRVTQLHSVNYSLQSRPVLKRIRTHQKEVRETCILKRTDSA